MAREVKALSSNDTDSRFSLNTLLSNVWLEKCLHFSQGSHKLWKSWKTWKIKKKSSMHGKIMEFDKAGIIMEKSWNFVK